jgi:CheY-like chemotaxis protein
MHFSPPVRDFEIPDAGLATSCALSEIPGVNSPRILVIEDNLALSQSLSDLLCDDGYSVGVARNGVEGLAEARRERPDVIVLDLLMPILDGWGFRTAQRADPALAEVPVLVLSASDDEERPDSAGYFSKPFEVDGLLGAIHRIAPQLPAGAAS